MIKRAFLLAAVLWLAASPIAADHRFYGGATLRRTLTVYVDPSAYGYDIASPVDYWNWASGVSSGAPIFAWWNGVGTPDVVITRDTGGTWVWKPCASCMAVVVLGYGSADWYNQFWLLHELGHAIGFADHLRPGQDPSGYINPGYQNGYNGVMNYASDVNWLSPDDYAMLWRWWFN